MNLWSGTAQTPCRPTAYSCTVCDWGQQRRNKQALCHNSPSRNRHMYHSMISNLYKQKTVLYWLQPPSTNAYSELLLQQQNNKTLHCWLHHVKLPPTSWFLIPFFMPGAAFILSYRPARFWVINEGI